MLKTIFEIYIVLQRGTLLSLLNCTVLNVLTVLFFFSGVLRWVRAFFIEIYKISKR